MRLKPCIAIFLETLSFIVLPYVGAAHAAEVKDATVQTEWCSAAPLPNTAVLIGQVDERLAPQHGSRTVFWQEKDLPKRVWCFLKDDQHPPREQQCVGLGKDNCLQGWVTRSIGRLQDQHHLVFDNEHSRDTRYLTLYEER